MNKDDKSKGSLIKKLVLAWLSTVFLRLMVWLLLTTVVVAIIGSVLGLFKGESKSGVGSGGTQTYGNINLDDFEEGTKGYWYAKMSIATGIRPGFIEAIHMIETTGAEQGQSHGNIIGPFQLTMEKWNGTSGGSDPKLGSLAIRNDFDGNGQEDPEYYVDAGYGFCLWSVEEGRLAEEWLGHSIGIHEKEAIMAINWNGWHDSFKPNLAQYDSLSSDDGQYAPKPIPCGDANELLSECPSALNIGNKDGAYPCGYYGFRAANYAEYYNINFYKTYSKDHKDWSSTGGSTATGKMADVINYAISKVGCKYSQGLRMSEGSYDCSSFVYRSYYEGAGINLVDYGATSGSPEWAPDTYNLANAGNDVTIDTSKPLSEQLQPGDFVFPKNLHHVVLYIGNGEEIEAMGTNYGVVKENIDSRYTSSEVVVRRVNL